MSKNWRKILITLGVVAAGILALNGQYFWAQIKYAISEKPTQESVQLPDNQEKGEPDLLVIESLGITTPIVYTESLDEKGYQEALTGGVVHFPGSANLGQPGNAYIFGHSSDFPWKPGEYKTVFALLPKIEIKEVIKVSDSEGRIYRYQVYETAVVDADDFSVLNQDTSGKKILTLQTSYPVGTALKRFIVKSELIEP